MRKGLCRAADLVSAAEAPEIKKNRRADTVQPRYAPRGRPSKRDQFADIPSGWPNGDALHLLWQPVTASYDNRPLSLRVIDRRHDTTGHTI